jgi:hypothetical protein
MASPASGKAWQRQTITLSAATASRAKALARAKGLSTSRLLARLVEEGLEAEQRKRSQFMELAERFRAAPDPAEAKKLGHELGRMIFGD